MLKNKQKVSFLSYMVTDALATKHDVTGYNNSKTPTQLYALLNTNIILHYHDWQVPQ